VYLIDNNDITDPYLNLALEEYAVRHLEKRRSYVLFYVNKPSLIVGKHQNVIEEINLKFAYEKDIPIIRRISGGGAVFHDLGNLNFSFITKQTLNNFNKYSTFLKLILEILNRLGASAMKDDHNNIRIVDKKVSGNAQFTSKNRLMSHGTLLFDTNLEILSNVLNVNANLNIESKSTKSIRSQVDNCKNHLKSQIDLNAFKKMVIKLIFSDGLKKQYLTKSDWDKIHKLAESKYNTWQWNFGLSPKCEIYRELNTSIGNIIIKITVENGLIQSFSLENKSISNKIHNQLQDVFLGCRFDFPNIKNIINTEVINKNLLSLNQSEWIGLFF